MPDQRRTVKNARLLKLAGHLRRDLPRQCFNIEVIVCGPSPELMLQDPDGCGTVACAFGSAPLFFEELDWDARGVPVLLAANGEPSPRQLARKFFCHTDAEWRELFAPGSALHGLSGLRINASPQRVALHIEEWVARHPAAGAA